MRIQQTFDDYVEDKKIKIKVLMNDEIKKIKVYSFLESNIGQISCGEQKCNEENMIHSIGIPPALDDKDKDGNGNPEKDPPKGGLGGGAIAGIVIAVLLVVAGIAIGVFFLSQK